MGAEGIRSREIVWEREANEWEGIDSLFSPLGDKVYGPGNPKRARCSQEGPRKTKWRDGQHLDCWVRRRGERGWEVRF